ncbi:MAG TPA: DUF72 domain-containing protein [Gemmatimonadaceae bacterium]|nr:DUF72 domain-containing protein [Gemmatimonadaceae bacterium]
MKLRAGTSGFAFKEWKGPFYPEKMKDADMLGFYATRFPTVEINNTFYRLPKEELLRGWAAQVPDDFSFSIKASQKITHFTRLKPESSEAVDYLLRTVACMERKLGPVLFQLPPNMKKDLERLNTFFDRLPKDRRYTVEFRHESWFDEDTFAALRGHNVAMCAIEQEDFRSPVVSTADWGYVRLHRFDYDAPRLAEWAAVVKSQPWTDAYVVFKHDEGIGSGPPAVDAFSRACAAVG